MDYLSFTFTVEQVNVLLAGLGELPAKVSLDLIAKIRQEGKSQMQTIAPTPIPNVEEKGCTECSDPNNMEQENA